ncbi:MAG: cytochrome c family protein [Alphaproteobacteria bacterium]|nr:cytochrome c family protein [Alphaproteobacteria bacterium]
MGRGRAKCPPHTAVATVGLLAAVALACPALAADTNSGKAMFSRCAACHTTQKGGPNGLGPNLFGVVGRRAGSKTDFSYSTALKNSGIVWSSQKLDSWIANPAKMVPGTRMIFPGIADQKQRTDLIAYLATLK